MKIKGPNWKKQKSRRWLKKYRDQRKASPQLKTFKSFILITKHPYLAPRSKIDLFIPLSKDQTPTPQKIPCHFLLQITNYHFRLSKTHARLPLNHTTTPLQKRKSGCIFSDFDDFCFQTHHSNLHSFKYTISSQNLVTHFITIKIKSAHALRLIKYCPFVISTQSLPPPLYNPL